MLTAFNESYQCRMGPGATNSSALAMQAQSQQSMASVMGMMNMMWQQMMQRQAPAQEVEIQLTGAGRQPKCLASVAACAAGRTRQPLALPPGAGSVSQPLVLPSDAGSLSQASSEGSQMQQSGTQSVSELVPSPELRPETGRTAEPAPLPQRTLPAPPGAAVTQANTDLASMLAALDNRTRGK